jgi:hypothetical protein
MEIGLATGIPADRTLDRLSLSVNLDSSNFHPGDGRLLGLMGRRGLAANRAEKPSALRSEIPESPKSQARAQVR